MKNNFEHISIFLLRSFSLLLKGSLLIVLSQFLTEKDYGQMVLFNSTMAVFLVFMGLNLHQYTAKLVYKTHDASIINNHLCIITVSGLTFLSITPFISDFLGLNNITYFFIGITFLEHINNEIYNILLPVGKSVEANIVFSIKTFLTIGIALLALYFFKQHRSLELVLKIWLISILMFSIFLFIRIKPRLKIDFNLLKQGWRIGFIFLFINIITKLFFNADKQIISHLFSLERTSHYGLVFSIAWTIPTILETTFISPSIKAFLSSSSHSNLIKKILFKISISYISLATVLIFTLPHLFTVLKKDYSQIYSLWMTAILIAGYFYLCALTISMSLYSRGKEKLILLSAIISIFFYIFLMGFRNSEISHILNNLIITNLVFLLLLVLIPFWKMNKIN